MTDLSGLDIARLLKDAKELSQITHSGRPDLSCGRGCKYLYYHQSCAVLALIERLEKAEAERDRLVEALEKIPDKHGFCVGSCGAIAREALASITTENETDE